MQELVRNLRYSVRVLLKSPGTTLVAVLSLALGIGANTTIFTLYNAVFLNPIPVENISRLVGLFTVTDANVGQFGGLLPISRPNFIDLAEQSDVLDDVAGYTFPFPVNLTTGGEPEQIFTELATGNYFDLLGVKPHRGRFFYPDEDETPGLKPVVVLSHALWQRRFGADEGILGRVVQINGLGFTVVGVTPERFKGVNAIGGPEMWVPMMMFQQVVPPQMRPYFDERRALVFSAVGRLKPDASVEQAKASVETIFARLEQEYPTANKGRSATAIPLREATIFPGLRQVLSLGGTVLMVVVGLVLLIACFNVANLLLARASSRRKEIAIRLSLGSSRSALIRQLLTESVMLAAIGGLLGVFVAFWGRDFIWAFRPPFVQQSALDLSLDWRVLSFTGAVSVLTGLLFGLAPALQSTRTDVAGTLKQEGRGTGAASGGFSLRNGLVVAQVGLSLVALVAAGLFVRSLGGAHDIDPGFETSDLAVLTVNPGQQGYEAGRSEQFFYQLLDNVAAVPGVESVSLASNLPLFGGFGRTVFLPGQSADDGQGQIVTVNTVDVGYFRTAGIDHLRGRTFDVRDSADSVKVAIVNEEMQRQLWPDEEAVGQRFQFFGDEEWREVVGVVQTSNYVTVGEDPQPCVFVPYRQNLSDTMALYVRSSRPAMALAAAQREVRALDPEVPTTTPLTASEIIEQSLWVARLGAGLLAALGSLALGLAAVGLYAVMAFWVAQRNREIGIRMALGASGGGVQRMVLRQSLALVGAGAVFGVVIALLAGRAVASLLYGVSPADPTTFVAVLVLLGTVAVFASWFPARRATRVDPISALHGQ